MIYDAVLCVKPGHKHIALIAIKSLYVCSQPRKIFVVSSRENFTFFSEKLNLPIYLLDENSIIANINLNTIQDYLMQRVQSNYRSGWYFQQFLKMAICNIVDIADYYLIWDSDTILLKNVDFFDKEGRVFISPKTAYHKPYFKLIKKILGIEKQVNFSFISEHMMINKFYMKELLNNLIAQTPDKISWVEFILNAIDEQHLTHSGFSEFETYGNFIATKYKDSFKLRPLKSIRGANIYGAVPNKYDVFSLMLSNYVFATFETWHIPSKKRVIANKIKSSIFYKFCNLTYLYRTKIDLANKILLS